MAVAPGAVVQDVRTLPPNLQIVRDELIARVQRVDEQMHRLEALIAAEPQNRRYADLWKRNLARAAALNDAIELLDTPTVRLIAHEQVRQRSQVRRPRRL